MSMRDNLNISAYLVLGPENTLGRPVGDIVAQALAAGFTIIQVRSKVCGARELMACAEEAARAIAAAGAQDRVPLLIDDRLDVALAARDAGIKVDGVHVGQSDVPVETCRRYLGEDAIVGLSARAHEMHDQVAQCTCAAPYVVNEGAELTIAVMDFGLKRGILKSLKRRGCTLKVYPADTPARTILENGCDGVMLTNGPGDPQDNPAAIAAIRELMDKVPVFGICLGHQLMALAMGGRTVQMKYGHHGANHPVKDLARGTCSVTPQNHCFMVDPDHLPEGAVVSHVNWNDQTVEGVRYTDRKAFSVQFHPEACGGPRETSYLFDDFLTMVRENKSK